jgi:hypothetical protein
MRTLLRWGVSLITLAVAVVLGTLARQNIEVFAEGHGWHSILRDGWQAVTALGLASWLTAAFFFFGGASIALWIDRWLRRFFDRPQTASHSFVACSRGESWDNIVRKETKNISEGFTVVPVLRFLLCYNSCYQLVMAIL